MFRHYGAAGLVLIILSYISRTADWVLFTEFFVVGYWLFFDALDFRLNGTSILHRIKRRNIILLYLVLAGIFIGLIFDSFGAAVSNLWYYPSLDIFYINGIIFGYGFPILMYYSAYRVVSKILRTEFGSFGKKLISRKEEELFFRLVIFIGIAGTLIPVISIPFLSSLSPVSRGMLFAFTLFGGWFVLEGIEYRQHKTSLLKDLFEGYWNPLAAIIIAALMTGFSWELLNTIDGSWKYQNLPFGASILGIPAGVLVGWIPLFIIYLSFYRVVSRRRDKIF